MSRRITLRKSEAQLVLDRLPWDDVRALNLKLIDLLGSDEKLCRHCAAPRGRCYHGRRRGG